MVLVFNQDAQAEQAGQTRAAPKLAAPAQPPLELLAEGFDRAAAHGPPRFFHGAVMEMILVILEVFDFAGDGFLLFG